VTALLDAIEFGVGLKAAAIAAGLRSAEFDVARDLLPRTSRTCSATRAS
jgi:hypothetical protein